MSKPRQRRVRWIFSRRAAHDVGYGQVAEAAARATGKRATRSSLIVDLGCARAMTGGYDTLRFPRGVTGFFATRS